MQPDPLITPGTSETETPGEIGTIEVNPNAPGTPDSPIVDSQKSATTNQAAFLAQNPNEAAELANNNNH